MKTTIIITGQLDTSTAFGVCMTTGERVFVPAAVARPINIIVNGEYEAVLIENVEQRREQAPWRAIKLFGEQVVVDEQGDAVTDAEVPKVKSAKELDIEAFKVLGTVEFASTSEMAEMLGVSTTTAGNSLQRLFNAGRISRAEVYHRVGQQRPSFVMYAMSASDFEGAD